MSRRSLYVFVFAFFVLAPIRAFAIDCPAGFVEVTPSATQGALGCVEANASPDASWEDAAQDCFDRVGGRLPTVEEWFVVWINFGALVDIPPSGPREWTADTSLFKFGETTGGDPIFSTGVVVVEIVSATLFATSAVSAHFREERPYRCWIVHP